MCTQGVDGLEDSVDVQAKNKLHPLTTPQNASTLRRAEGGLPDSPASEGPPQQLYVVRLPRHQQSERNTKTQETRQYFGRERRKGKKKKHQNKASEGAHSSVKSSADW